MRTAPKNPEGGRRSPFGRFFMSRFEIFDGSSGPEIRGFGREDEIEDPEPLDEEDDRPSRPVSTPDFPIRLPGYRELDTRVQRREEG